MGSNKGSKAESASLHSCCVASSSDTAPEKADVAHSHAGSESSSRGHGMSDAATDVADSGEAASQTSAGPPNEDTVPLADKPREEDPSEASDGTQVEEAREKQPRFAMATACSLSKARRDSHDEEASGLQHSRRSADDAKREPKRAARAGSTLGAATESFRKKTAPHRGDRDTTWASRDFFPPPEPAFRSPPQPRKQPAARRQPDLPQPRAPAGPAAASPQPPPPPSTPDDVRPRAPEAKLSPSEIAMTRYSRRSLLSPGPSPESVPAAPPAVVMKPLQSPVRMRNPDLRFFGAAGPPLVSPPPCVTYRPAVGSPLLVSSYTAMPIHPMLSPAPRFDPCSYVASPAAVPRLFDGRRARSPPPLPAGGAEVISPPRCKPAAAAAATREPRPRHGPLASVDPEALTRMRQAAELKARSVLSKPPAFQ
ncbi:hypothetical protein DIPPA_06211 [Diplonema papillatum]|nr:hypothetical protein DIPPA_06211 [Diplonema papillatum]